MADKDYSPIPTQDQKNFSNSLKNATGQNPNSLWGRITGGSTADPTPEEKMKAMQKRNSSGPKTF